MADPGYRWRDGHPQRRREWAATLAASPVTCGAPTCGRLVYADPALNWDGRTWHLGHGVAVSNGGDGSDARPWHATCNMRQGADDYRAPASRDWWQ